MIMGCGLLTTSVEKHLFQLWKRSTMENKKWTIGDSIVVKPGVISEANKESGFKRSSTVLRTVVSLPFFGHGMPICRSILRYLFVPLCQNTMGQGRFVKAIRLPS